MTRVLVVHHDVDLADEDRAPESGALHAARLTARGFDLVLLADTAGRVASYPEEALAAQLLARLKQCKDIHSS